MAAEMNPAQYLDRVYGHVRALYDLDDEAMVYAVWDGGRGDLRIIFRPDPDSPEVFAGYMGAILDGVDRDEDTPQMRARIRDNLYSIDAERSE